MASRIPYYDQPSANLRCPYTTCRKFFSTRYNLTKHVNVHHRKLLKFTCQRCGRAFGYKHTLRNHVTLHAKLLRKCEAPLLEGLRELMARLAGQIFKARAEEGRLAEPVIAPY